MTTFTFGSAMERYTDFDYIFKTIIVGDSGVGKTCLLERFVDDRFLVDFATTIGVDFKLSVMQTEGKVIKLQIWCVLVVEVG